MKTIISFFFLAFFLQVFSQVGINTMAPTSMLDIDGDVRIRNIPIDNTLSNILVVNNAGNVYQNQIIYTPPLKTFVRAKGGSSISLLSLTALLGWYQIAFNSIDFDENSEYNTTNYQFTAKQDGVYDIYLQAKTESVVSASEYGVGIFKKNVGETNYTLIAEETFLSININILAINVDVSPPSRNTRTLIKLKKGDVIIFGVKVPLVSLKLIGNTSSFFSINQVK